VTERRARSGFTFPKSARMPESSIEGGKLVTYNVDFHARWTVTSCPWIRFLSLVKAAGTLSCIGDVRLTSRESSPPLASYPIGEFDSGNLEVCKLGYLNLSYFAALESKRARDQLSLETKRESLRTSLNKAFKSSSAALSGKSETNTVQFSRSLKLAVRS